MSGKAIENLTNAPLDELVISDTIPLSEDKKIDKIKVLSIDNMIAEAQERITSKTKVIALLEAKAAAIFAQIGSL